MIKQLSTKAIDVKKIAFRKYLQTSLCNEQRASKTHKTLSLFVQVSSLVL
jgi:hypothetical protein